MLPYLTKKKFAIESGYTLNAIDTKIRDGVWRLGREFTKAPDGQVLISVEGFTIWVENQSSSRTSERSLEVVSKSRSTSPLRKIDNVSELSLSPQPLI